MSDTHSSQTRPKKIWWLIATLILMLCVLIQVPAAWLLQTFVPDHNALRGNIEQISGNVWHGTAVVKLPAKKATIPTQSGSLEWDWQPTALLSGKIGVDVDFVSGQTELSGEVRKGLSVWQIKELTGIVDKQILGLWIDWQLPDAPIRVNNLSLTRSKLGELSTADGQLTWAGGDLGYPSGGKVYNILLPAMRADIESTQKNGVDMVHASLVDNDSKRLGDFYVDNEGMLDASLTQRFLEYMPSYKGTAPADTAVVSVRQPLISNSH